MIFAWIVDLCVVIARETAPRHGRGVVRPRERPQLSLPPIRPKRDGHHRCLGGFSAASTPARRGTDDTETAQDRIYLRNGSCGRSAYGDYDMGGCPETCERFGCADSEGNGLPA